MRRVKQTFYPEGYFDFLRTKHMTNEEIDAIIGSNKIASGRAIAYIDSQENSHLKVDMGNGKMGIINTSSKDTYKYKSLVNEIINFCIVGKLSDNEYLLKRNFLIHQARDIILKNYKAGDIVKGKVVSFLGYGAIIDIGWGTTALLHKTDIIGNPIHPKAVLKTGEILDVEIKNISDDGNIYLKMLGNGC